MPHDLILLLTKVTTNLVQRDLFNLKIDFRFAKSQQFSFLKIAVTRLVRCCFSPPAVSFFEA